MERRNRSIPFQCHSLIFAAFTIACLIIFANGTASAKTSPLALCVNHSGSGGCSTTIQDAVNMVAAGGSAVITIAADVTPYAEDVTVSNATISFVGGGAGMTIVDGTNVSSMPTFLFENNASGELHSMTIENGNGALGSNVQFEQFAPKGNKGVGTLKIENCEITGGVHPSNVLPEGAVNFVGKTLTIDSSSIDDNTDEGLLIGGAPHVFITNTTISGNDTTGNNGNATGCGIHISAGTVVLNNDTITDNHCVGGSGHGQSPTQGGGIWVDFPGKVAISNTVIANNTVAGTLPSGPDCFAPGKGVKSKGFNLIKDTSACNITLQKSDLAPETDPSLGPLTACASSGLEVQTPNGGSPIIGKGNPGKLTGKAGAKGSTCLPTDECGTARAKGSCTIGAAQ
jgi:Right handed beta helix region